MIAADLPPSSRLTRFSCSPHSPAIRRPTALDPVNAILSTPGWRTSASPASVPPLAAFGPGKVGGDRQREVYQRHRRRRLAEPAETSRRTHLVGDQVGHL